MKSSQTIGFILSERFLLRDVMTPLFLNRYLRKYHLLKCKELSFAEPKATTT